MRLVYEGGDAWQRAAAHYPELEEAEEGGGAPVSLLPRAAEDRLTRFVRRWRAHFVAAVTPVALPSYWAPGYTVFQENTRTRDKLEPALAKEFAEAR